MLSSTVWIIGLTCLMLGGILGAFFTRLLNPGEQKSRELEQHLQESQNNFKAYQGQVEEHFRQTADLIGSLTETYRDVHNHLAEGAQQLCETGAGGPVLTRLTETDEHDGEKEPGSQTNRPLRTPNPNASE